MYLMSKPAFTNTVLVRPFPDQSDAEAGIHAFSYTVTIKNTGDITAQLIARHWIITDARGTVEEVRGLAVVGHQPVLKPGEHFEYTSWARLNTPHGTMRGTFFGMTEDAYSFESAVPEFALADPSTLH
jgi:ApaG protein